MDINDSCAAFRIEPPIPDEPTYITIKHGSILMIDNLKKKGVKYLVAISQEELDVEINLSSGIICSDSFF